MGLLFRLSSALVMPQPAVGKKKALIASKAVKQGVNTKKTKKTRTNVHFYRPKTLELNRRPKYPRKSLAHTNKMDQYRVIRHPLTSESAKKDRGPKHPRLHC